MNLLELIEESDTCPSLSALNGVTAAFEYFGPASTLVRKLKYHHQPYLAKGLAAFMSAQFLKTDWPMPDLIVPVPLAFTHWINRGYNQSRLLADELSTILRRPVSEALKRESGDYSQAGLSRKQREAWNGSSIKIHQEVSLDKRVVLLVDDVMTTGTTLTRCAEALAEAGPEAIYALCACRAIK